jgi:hypothetical protein
MPSLFDIRWRPGTRDLRWFGAGLLVCFGLLGAAFYFGWPQAQSRTAGLVLWIAGGASGTLGLTGTRLARPLYLAWMGFAWLAGNVVSCVVLTLVFLLVILPMGLFFRLIGRDRLGLRRRSESYWSDLSLPEDPARYERQF